MKRIAGGTFVFAASFVAAVGVAQAADLPVSSSPVMSPVAVAFNWTGLYAGVHGGYAWADSSSSFDNSALSGLSTAAVKPSGGYGGGQIGMNYQLPQNFVIGIEADASFDAIEDTVDDPNSPGDTVTTKIDYSGTVRGRLGYAFDRVLVYGTGGFAWAHAKTSVPALSDSDDAMLTGWTAGGGIEYAFANHWSVKAEYLHVDYSDHTWFKDSLWSSTGGATADTVRVGANYRF
jgi:outer membrane immunogenic protein